MVKVSLILQVLTRRKVYLTISKMCLTRKSKKRKRSRLSEAMGEQKLHKICQGQEAPTYFLDKVSYHSTDHITAWRRVKALIKGAVQIIMRVEKGKIALARKMRKQERNQR
jgi:hypothetical protein